MSMTAPLHDQIARRRVEVNLSQERLGEAIGRNQSIISRIESGGLPLTADTIQRLLVPLRVRVVFDRCGAHIEPDEDGCQ